MDGSKACVFTAKFVLPTNHSRSPYRDTETEMIANQRVLRYNKMSMYENDIRFFKGI